MASMGIDLQSPSMLANSVALCYHEEHACVTFKAQMNNVGSMVAYYKQQSV
jgi:hypothetical protein